MKKFLTLLLIIFIAQLVGALYGILNDQLTYTISPEFYTKVMFYRFELAEPGSKMTFANPRTGVTLVGIIATLWMGFPIGLILGLIGMVHSNYKQMLRETLKAILVVIVVAFTTGILGLVYGRFYLADRVEKLSLPANLIDTKNFISVDTMHGFSYAGALIGLIVAIVYSIQRYRKYGSMETT